MGEREHTPGPWLRDGRTVYALDERKNANRFSFQVQEGYLHHTRYERTRTSDEELEATAALAQAAPCMLEAIEEVRSQAEMLFLAIIEGDPASELKLRVNDILDVLAKASPASPSQEASRVAAGPAISEGDRGLSAPVASGESGEETEQSQ